MTATFWPRSQPTLIDSLAGEFTRRLGGSGAHPERIWSPLPHQAPPDGDWDAWMILAGRGSGKTRAGAEYVLAHLEANPNARVGIGAPTIADARDVCAEGDSGLITIAPDRFTSYNRSLGEARHVNGGYVKFLGSETPARWNGPQWSLLWTDELALWNEESWHQALFGLRLGNHPRAIVTTTPKSRRFVRELSEHARTVVTRAATHDNPHLSQHVRDRLDERYGGTRMGRQELLAEWVDDVDGALWQRAWLDAARVVVPPELARIVVAIDPAVTSKSTSDETGVVVAGIGTDGEWYVLAAQGYQLSPQGWASRAVDLYDRHEADRIIAERNNGGEMVEATIRSVRRDVPVKTVHASRGKTVRAEPVAALYEQGRVHHVGVFPALEDQMSSFPVAAEHDDLVDALVYAITELSERGERSRPRVRSTGRR